MNFRSIPAVCLSVAVTALLCAQDPQQPPQQQQTDPPSRVARLNYINPAVSFRPGSQEEWAPSTLNYPLTTGDHLWSEQQGGAEMHIGSTALRIAGGTSFSILNLDDHAIQVSVSQGFMNARIRHLDEGETVEVDTPNGAISLLRSGDYRVDVDSNANVTTVTVRGGEAEVNGGGQAFPVNPGQRVRFTGSDQLNAEPTEATPPDQWDQWCSSRDERDDRAEQAVAPYVGNNMIGAEDLAGQGEWHQDPAYGAYWVPRVEAGWAPYREGHWAYVVPWGWTWVDDAPWGFAPFHYGRWAMAGGVWAWYPGAVVARPVYAPAMVAFVGGSGFSAAIGIGGVGVAAWVPLGPREVYRPYYRVSDVYVRNVNVTHVTVTNINVTNVNYVNRTYVTAVRQDAFVGARPVSAAYVRVPASAYGRMQSVTTVSYQPAREAYLGRRMEGVRVVSPPATVVNRTVIVNRAPPVMAGRPAMATYRSAPPVTRRMEYNSQGHYQPSMNTGNTGRYVTQPSYGNRGAQYGNRPNAGTQQTNPSTPNYGNRGVQYGNRPNTGTQQTNTPAPNYSNRGEQYGNRPNTGTQQNNATPNYGHRGGNNSTLPQRQPNTQSNGHQVQNTQQQTQQQHGNTKKQER